MSASTRVRRAPVRAFKAPKPLLGILSVLTLVVVDVLFGLLYEYVTPRSGRIAVGLLTGSLDPREVQSIQRHPYMLYVNTPGWKDKAGIRQINSMGYVGSDITPHPAPGVIRILAIGGSTTLSYPYVEDPSLTWPAQLQSLLKQEQQRVVEVVNGGLSFATSAELLAHYMFRDRYLGARIVVVHTGLNDVAPLVSNNYNPEYTHWRSGWGPSALQQRPGESLLLRSNVARAFYAWWLQGASIDQFLAQKEPVHTLAAEVLERNVKANEPIGFRRNLALLVQNIIQDGSMVILFPEVLAPIEKLAVDSKISGITPEQYKTFTMGLEKNKHVIYEVATQYSIPCIEISDGKIPVSSFLDLAHLDAAGEHIKAQHIADVLKPLIESL
jgi:lysophospholipase L1-like esterase